MAFLLKDTDRGEVHVPLAYWTKIFRRQILSS
jgi:hypothetical protein